MVCQCTVANDIYCIWLHFIAQRTSCCPSDPPHFSPSCALMIPWVWSSSVEVIFFLVGCLLDPVNYKLLYWRCWNRNPYLLFVVVGFFFSSLNLRTITYSNSPNNSQAIKHSEYFLWLFFCTTFFSGTSWFQWCITAQCIHSYGAYCLGRRGQNKVRRETEKLHYHSRRVNILIRGSHCIFLPILCPERIWS